MNKKRQESVAGAQRRSAQSALGTRDYSSGTFRRTACRERSRSAASSPPPIAAIRRSAKAWIPGRRNFRAHHSSAAASRHCSANSRAAMKGSLAEIGLWPTPMGRPRACSPRPRKAFMFIRRAFPKGRAANEWFQRLFIEEPENFSLRRYEEEQWDVMFFVQGRAEMILRDVRAGLPTRTMRFFIDGDNHRGANNVAVVIPPGVAHAIRVEGSEDLIMVYGTSTSFRPEFEGRIASDVETAPLPESWQRFPEANLDCPDFDEAAVRSGGAGIDGPAAAGHRRAGVDLQICARSIVTSAATRWSDDFLRRWIKPGQSCASLDLATGSGDIPRSDRRSCAAVGATVADRRGRSSGIDDRDRAELSADYPEIQFTMRGYSRIRRRAVAYDIVLCSLALHHFSGRRRGAFAEHCRELSRAYVLVSDLRRGWLPVSASICSPPCSFASR